MARTVGDKSGQSGVKLGKLGKLGGFPKLAVPFRGPHKVFFGVPLSWETTIMIQSQPPSACSFMGICCGRQKAGDVEAKLVPKIMVLDSLSGYCIGISNRPHYKRSSSG